MKDSKEKFDTKARLGSERWYESTIRNATSMKAAYILLVLGSVISIAGVISLICGYTEHDKYVYWGMIIILFGYINFERFESRRAIVRLMKDKTLNK